jgi:hypothetical protein
MINYKKFISPLVPTVGLDAGSAFAWHMQSRLGNQRAARHKAALAEREGKLASAAPNVAALPRPQLRSR